MPIKASAVATLGLSGSDVARLTRSLDSALGAFLPEPVAATTMMATAASVDPSAPSNIVGLGVGARIEAGGKGTPQIVVLVRRKVGIAALASNRVVPERLDGFPTTVVETGDIVTQFTNRRRPTPGGVSIGNCTLGMAGTLGCYVHIERDDGAFILSNNHVLALVNASPPGTGIPQPGLLDGGVCGADVIADLTRHIPINFAGVNIVDCAIARLAPGTPIDRGMLRTSAGAIEQLRSPHRVAALGDAVQKSGRTTGHTLGSVTLVGVSVNVNMGTPLAPLLARFDDQFQVSGLGMAFSRSGDSGSLVTVTEGNHPVGLLFAGGSGVTFCNDIGNVLSALGVAILY